MGDSWLVGLFFFPLAFLEAVRISVAVVVVEPKVMKT